MPKAEAPDLVQKGLMCGGVPAVLLRETARSVEFEGVVIEGVSRAREGESDADEPEVR